MRHKQHRRKRCVRVGSIAIDLASLSHGFGPCLVGVAKSDKDSKRAMCLKVESKGKNHIEAAISRIALQAEQFWVLPVIRRIHCDKESGVAACDDFLATRAIRLTATQGADPQVNGEADSAVGEVCRGAGKSPLHSPDRAVRRRLWPCAVIHRGFALSQDSGNPEGTKAAEDLSRKIAPFACKVIVKPTELDNKKCDKVTADGICLHPGINISGAHVIAVLGDHMFIDRVGPFVTFTFAKEDGNSVSPFVGIHLAAQDREWIGVTVLRSRFRSNFSLIFFGMSRRDSPGASMAHLPCRISSRCECPAWHLSYVWIRGSPT